MAGLAQYQYLLAPRRHPHHSGQDILSLAYLASLLRRRAPCAVYRGILNLRSD
jgi:hypothetical protein